MCGLVNELLKEYQSKGFEFLLQNQTHLLDLWSDIIRLCFPCVARVAVGLVHFRGPV